jgi:predicted anti-sigma-YlaC factor YlaD
MSEALARECAEARAAIQDLLDGPLAGRRRQALDEHLARCSACREVQSGLRNVRLALRSLPEIPLPEDALAEVWARTIDAPRPTGAAARPVGWKTVAALAASLLLAVVLLWSGRVPGARQAPSPDDMTQAEIEQIQRETRQALRVTAAAVHLSREVALDRVLEREISPAIRRIPVRWPETGTPASRRPRT